MLASAFDGMRAGVSLRGVDSEEAIQFILGTQGTKRRIGDWAALPRDYKDAVEAILKLARSARPGTGAGADTDRLIAWGPGPRASQALMLAVRAKALIDGRLAPSVDDVIALAEPVLKHRMALTFAARAEGETASGVINRLASALE